MRPAAIASGTLHAIHRGAAILGVRQPRHELHAQDRLSCRQGAATERTAPGTPGPLHGSAALARVQRTRNELGASGRLSRSATAERTSAPSGQAAQQLDDFVDCARIFGHLVHGLHRGGAGPGSFRVSQRGREPSTPQATARGAPLQWREHSGPQRRAGLPGHGGPRGLGARVPAAGAARARWHAPKSRLHARDVAARLCAVAGEVCVAVAEGRSESLRRRLLPPWRRAGAGQRQLDRGAELRQKRGLGVARRGGRLADATHGQ